MSKLTIEGWPEPIVLGRRSLLDTALAAGVPAPHDCRAGECGSCKCRLLKGEVEEQPALAEALSPSERAGGWVLSCRSFARGSVEIAYAGPLVEALPPLQKVDVRVVAIERVAADVIRLVLRPERPLQFLPGQYLNLMVPGFPARSFSPASAPGEQPLIFYVRLLPGGLVSQHLAGRVRPGDRLRLSGPHGQACLQGPPCGPLLLAGGGTGLAPLLSILRYLSVRAPGTPVLLLQGFRRPEDRFGEEELSALGALLPGLRVVTRFSEAAPRGERLGFLAPALLEEAPVLSETGVFVAGPPPLVESLRTAALQLGAVPGAIRSDPFLPARVSSTGLAASRIGRWLRGS